jgi:ribulose-phosphate 3-epimerase
MRSKSPIIPAVLTTNIDVFSQHLEFAREVGNSLHVDVIDNDFCQGKSLEIRDWPELLIEYTEAHLMVREPLSYLSELAAKKVTRAIIHIESNFDLIELADQARRLDILLGWAVNPDTDLDKLRNFYPVSNYIQLMGVQPGLTGQPFIDTVYPAIRYLAKNPARRLIVSVDGGVSLETTPKLIAAGADYLVSSAAIFERGNTWKANYEQLEQIIHDR